MIYVLAALRGRDALWHVLPNLDMDTDISYRWRSLCEPDHRVWAKLRRPGAAGPTCLQCLVHLARFRPGLWDLA